jgi:hypothetical protein
LPFADRLHWHHDRLFMEPPGRGHRPVPDRPVFADRFDRPDGAVGASWTLHGEGWRLRGNQMVFQAAGGALASAAPRTEPLVHHVLEANVRFDRSDARSLAGVSPFVSGEDRVDVLVDCARRVLITRGRIGQSDQPERASPLPADFECAAYHQILTTRSDDRIVVELDGVRAQQREFPFGGRPGGVALIAGGPGVEFDGIALTSAYDDAFDAPARGWTMASGTWLAAEGVLQQVAGGAAQAVALKGERGVEYEFAASLRWREGEGIAALAGIVAAAAEDGALVTAGFNRDLWPFARFIVRHVTAAGVQPLAEIEMPRGFRYDEFHTLRVARQGDAFTFFLDGAAVAALRVPIGPSRPGVFTEGVRADFDEARMKRTVVGQNLLLDGGFESEQWRDGQPSSGNVWRFAGAARMNACCAHSGGKRLLIAGGAGEARQTLRLPPGSYVAYARIRAQGDTNARLVVEHGGKTAVATEPGSAEWMLVSVAFTVTGREAPIAVGFVASPRPATDDYAAADDLYLAEVPRE